MIQYPEKDSLALDEGLDRTKAGNCGVRKRGWLRLSRPSCAGNIPRLLTASDRLVKSL